ncbi:copper amine oxidase N-terminal domain-containing protein [Paenibacillus cremeus]|uniref:Copper amine oxidase N-terminal domain-containing protein n=1 Tax=Paenibacillus cremeus TaxID=2163881 RepID=A0A559K9Z3_9BACL|nr:copper amine oxidase N-terminal domain-containing protein [Paenibacillus cremeus]TVY08913.1 copper amine oxidase N-terminal domain-containing protein [Paenibacillus cremeus]
MNYRMNQRIAAIAALSISLMGGSAYAAEATPQPIKAIVISAPMAQEQLQVTVNGAPLSVGGFKLADAKESMLPLRSVAEALGFTLTWNAETMSADLVKGNLQASVVTGEDRYAMNKMSKPLGTASALVDSKLFVPAAFVSEMLQAQVSVNESTVSISSAGKIKTATTKGIITALQNKDGHQTVRINGVGTDGIVLNVSKDTLFASANSTDTTVQFSDLTIGTEIEVEHSMAMTMSLPPQTAAYLITIVSKPEAADFIGTSGSIEEVRTSEDGVTSLLIKGAGLTEQSQSAIVLQLTDKTSLVGKDGQPIDKSVLVKGAKVIGFYNGVLTKSLPPIGKAAKIVLQASAE